MPRPPRPRSAPTGQTETPKIISVPKSGELIVRFLGKALGMVHHYKGTVKIPCIGEGDCKVELHRTNPTWYAYAPGSEYIEALGVWVDGAVEITEFMWSHLKDRILRGEAYRYKRHRISDKKTKCWGEQIDTYDEHELPPAFCIKQIVQRCYREENIAWGIDPIFEELEKRPVRKDRPPAGIRAPLPPEVQAAINKPLTPEQISEAIRTKGASLQTNGGES